MKTVTTSIDKICMSCGVRIRKNTSCLVFQGADKFHPLAEDFVHNECKDDYIKLFTRKDYGKGT